MNTTAKEVNQYQFTPEVDSLGIYDYTGVEPNKIQLPNKNTILSQDLPSYLPPVHIRRNMNYDIPAFKVSDNEYLLRESDTPRKSESGQSEKPRLYRVSLDVYAALVQYHLQFDRAAFSLLAQKNNEARLLALSKGEQSFKRINERSLPIIPCSLEDFIIQQSDLSTVRNLHNEEKPSRVVLKKSKSKSMSVEPYYFINSIDRHLSKREIFRMHETCLDDIRQKIIDIEAQQIDYESSWTKGRETSYGDGNVNTSLLSEYGVLVKRQNGDYITDKEIKEIADTISVVHSVYGDLSGAAREFNLKISHAGTTRMHASKFIGLFSSYHRAIGISFPERTEKQYGVPESILTASHEYAHFLDHISGKSLQAWYSSDIPGTTENKIAVSFRQHMIPIKGDYWSRTCECFARAMQEYTQITLLKENNPEMSFKELYSIVSKDAFVSLDAYEQHILPLVETVLSEYKQRFVSHTVKSLESESSPEITEKLVAATKENVATEIVITDYQNRSFTQLELFDSGEKRQKTIAPWQEQSETDFNQSNQLHTITVSESDPELSRDHLHVAKGMMKTLVRPVLSGDKTGLWTPFRKFKQHGVFDIQGSQVATENGVITNTGWKQLATAMSIYRDKRFETFRVLYISENGEIADQVAVSSHLPDRVSLAPIMERIDEINQHAQRTQTKVVIAHNHPSGNVNPSEQDKFITQILAQHLPLVGHIILDHNSFGLCTDTLLWFTELQETWKPHDPLMKARNPALAEMRISNQAQLEYIARQINEEYRWNSTDWSPIVFTSTGFQVTGLRYYKNSYLNNISSEKLLSEFQKTAVQNGFAHAFPVVVDGIPGAEVSKFIRHYKNGCFTDFYINGLTSQDFHLEGINNGLFNKENMRTQKNKSSIESTFDLEEKKGIVQETTEAVASKDQGEYGGQERNDNLLKMDTSPGLLAALESISKGDIDKSNAYITIADKTGNGETKMDQKEVRVDTILPYVLTSERNRKDFYTSIGIDPAEPLFAEGKALQDITSTIHGSPEHDESGLVIRKAYVLSADDVLYAAFMSDREHEDGIPLSSIHGIDDFLRKRNFNLAGVPEATQLFNKALNERESFLNAEKVLNENTTTEVTESIEEPKKSYNQIHNEGTNNNQSIVFSFKRSDRFVQMKIDDAEWTTIGRFPDINMAQQVLTMLEEDYRTGRRREHELYDYDEETQVALDIFYNEREYSNQLKKAELSENTVKSDVQIGLFDSIDQDTQESLNELNIQQQNLTESVQESYNNRDETLMEDVYDDSNGPESQNERKFETLASERSLSESEELRSNDVLRTGRHADIRAGSDILQSEGREDLRAVGHTAVNGEFSESSFVNDSDGGRSLRAGSMSETESSSDRGQSEVNTGSFGNGYVSTKTLREIRSECIHILESKKDSEITEKDRMLLAQYEGAGGLGEKEASAAGVLSEFYTPEPVIQSVWRLVDAYHPDAQTVLEPSAGTGRFAHGRNEQFTLHELDETSSRIARLLHPEATVITGAFQKQFFDPSGRVLKKGYSPPTYDVVVGNPPYGTYTGKWKGLGEGKHHARYEEYFIEKGLDSLNPDGVLAYVVPSGFLRSGRDSVKEIIAAKGTLLDAWRLPNGAFPTTEVGTDIIVMKRGISDPDLISNDRFFIDHPEHILGEETVRQGRFGQEQYIAIPDGQDLQTLLEKINPIINYSKQVNNSVEQRHLEKESIANPTRGNENTVTLNKDYNLNTVSTEKSIQSEGQSRQNPNSQRTSAEEMRYKNRLLSSSEFAKVYGKEHDEREQPIWAATSWNGFIDLDKLTVDDRLFLKSQSKYIEVSPGRWMHKILFASGNIYEKLVALEAEYSSGKITQESFTKQTEILEEALPKRTSLSDIHFSPMATLAQEFMVPISGGRELPLREGFVNWVTGYAEENEESYFGRRNFDPALSPISKEDLPANIGWSDIIEYLDGEPVRARRGWSEEHKKAQQIEAEKKRVARRETADKLFDRYIHEGLDENSAKRLETEWNRRFNNMVSPDYFKLPLYVDGMSVYKGSEPFTLYEQQIKGISFLSNKGNGLLAYDVGVGKTAAGIVATVNQIQTGRATRPLIIVPKSVYSKWTRDIQQLFPNIPVNDLGNFSDKHLAKYRTDEYGLSIPEKSISVCTIEALQRISFTDSSIMGPLFEDFSNLLGGVDDDGSDRSKKLHEEKIVESVGHASQTKEGFVFWEHTGFDHVTVDEAHRFKNLYKTPRSTEKGKANEYAGLGAGNPSARALKLFGITQLVQRNNDNRNVFLLTATPFTNSPLEVYSMLSYMGRERLKEMHLYNLKSFMDEFAEMKNEWAVDAKGTIQSRQVMKNFRSLPALQNLLFEYIDKVDGEEAGVIRPLKFTHVEKLEPTALQKQIIEAETERMLDKQAGKNGGVLVAMNNMRMAMLSPALLQDVGYKFEIPPLSEMVDSSPKLKMVCDTIVDCWNKEPTGGQILYMPRGVEESKYVKEYLVQKGIPKNVIGFINSSVTDAKKDSLTEAFNDKTNALKIIIGSETISEGVDLNGNSYVCYNTMLGWNPTETIQVEGRAWRQGNEQGHVHMVYPLMEDSIDALLYQKYDEKSSRINALWSYKGDRLNVEDINPEELKFDLIKDPAKKADFILSEKTVDLRTEQVLIKGKIETIDAILDKKITFETQLEEHQEEVSRWIERKKENRFSPIFYDQMIERENEKKASAERNLPAIQKKLEGMGLESQDKIDAYIRSLNERKKEIEEEIKNILESKDEIITNLRIEEEKKKAVLPTFEESQRMLVEKITGNLRPMAEVEKEIRELRGNQSKRRNILAALSELENEHASKPEIKNPESQVEQNTQPSVATEEKQDQNKVHIPLVVDKETGQFSLFDDVVMNTTPEVFAAESSTQWELDQKQDERNKEEFMRQVETQVLDYMSNTQDESIQKERSGFYTSVSVDPHAKLLYPNKSLSDIIFPIEHGGITRNITADVILQSAFLSDKESSTGVTPATIHGIDEYLNPSNFSLTYFGMPQALNEVARLREQYIQNDWRYSGKDLLSKEEKTQESANQEVNTEAVQITENPVLEGLNGDGTEPNNSATKHKTADNVQNNALSTEGNAKKPYYQLNAEKLLTIIKDGSAPFLQSESDTTAVFIKPKAVLSATTGRAFKGMNQLLAQNALMEAGITDTQIITYEQAKEHGVGIKKGQLNFVLTNYDVITRISSANRYYPVSAVYNREQLPPVEARPSSVKANILCTESDPATYLGKYLAATAMNARFETTKDTQQEFREKIIAHLETSFAENKHSKAFELGNKASAICRATMSEIFSKLQIHSRNMSQQSPITENKGIQIEPHNPVTGEVFVGENAKKAVYLMERRNSRDPRFVEYADILKAGLELKADAKEMLTIKDQGKTRFFYNAEDIEGMPIKSNTQQLLPKKVQAERKTEEYDMSM